MINRIKTIQRLLLTYKMSNEERIALSKLRRHFDYGDNISNEDRKTAIDIYNKITGEERRIEEEIIDKERRMAKSALLSTSKTKKRI